MSDEGFFRRWSRRKHETQLGREPAPEPGQQDAPDVATAATPLAPAATNDGASAAHKFAQGAPAEASANVSVDSQVGDGTGEATATGKPSRLPTMADVAELTPDSDYSSFVARGVDGAVRRTALKKLFADPHFNVMDRLDVYIDDYTKPSPVSPAMLASLRHARSVFERLVEDEDTVVADAVPAVDAATAAPLAQEASSCPEQSASAGAGEIASPTQADAPADAQAPLADQAAQVPQPDGSAAASPDAGDSLEHDPASHTYQQHLPETETR